MRRQILSKADLMIERQQEIAGLVTEETGGVFGWAMFNVELTAGMLREAAAQADNLVGEVIPSDVPGKLAMGVRQPAGPVVAIAPWNAPVILSTRAVATPLAYANTVVLKASELCPRTHAAVVKALVDAGLPEGVINLITNAPEDAGDLVDELIAHPAKRRINFTGSSKIGRIIAEKAGRHLKRVLLELGGKAPIVVLGGADLDLAPGAAPLTRPSCRTPVRRRLALRPCAAGRCSRGRARPYAASRPPPRHPVHRVAPPSRSCPSARGHSGIQSRPWAILS
jgi:acyl-CoA reductase-like NAD-dependent aldehyde dehydrogenase